jgi:ubiquinone/menaquinone biosynthesis C-methylase UbiE
MTAPANFDRLVRIYRPLEFLSFGRDLERARTGFADRLSGCREILVLGEGDGRYLEQLVRAAPAARVRCVDASPAMLARAAARIAGHETRERVTFEQADALGLTLPTAHYDAVATLFFLDCFTPAEAASLVARIQPSLRPGALWAWADFAIPPRGWAHWRARGWLALLYLFFRWQTGLSARSLPPAEAILQQAGFDREAERDFQGGLVRSAIFRLSRPGSVSN